MSLDQNSLRKVLTEKLSNYRRMTEQNSDKIAFLLHKQNMLELDIQTIELALMSLGSGRRMNVVNDKSSED